MGILDVIARVTRLQEGVHLELEESQTPVPEIVIDDQLSSVSENAVQNKVITNAINQLRTNVSNNTSEITVLQNDVQELENEKQDASPLIRRIYVGNDEPPSNTIGRNGDLYFVIP